MKKQLSLAFCLLILSAFGATAQQTPKTSSADEYKDYAVKEVGAIHGGTGPFAVAGYRMGARAMLELELLRGSFDWNVEHDSLPEVRWSCIADGIQAATGASVGKLTLTLIQVKEQKQVQSIIVNKKTGEKIIFRLTDSFLKKYYDTPYEQLNQMGRAVMDLKDEDIFTMEIIPGDKPQKPSPFERKRAEAGKLKTENTPPPKKSNP